MYQVTLGIKLHNHTSFPKFDIILIIIDNIMGKGQDAKKNVKKEPAKTAKEKRAEKKLKKAKYD